MPSRRRAPDRDWAKLWWSRADGAARVLAASDPEARHGVDLLVARYRQWEATPPGGDVLAITVKQWSGWRSSE